MHCCPHNSQPCPPAMEPLPLPPCDNDAFLLVKIYRCCIIYLLRFRRLPRTSYISIPEQQTNHWLYPPVSKSLETAAAFSQTPKRRTNHYDYFTKSLLGFQCTPAMKTLLHILFKDADFGFGISIWAQCNVQWDVVFPILHIS